jgi:hypothetical protein
MPPFYELPRWVKPHFFVGTGEAYRLENQFVLRFLFGGVLVPADGTDDGCPYKRGIVVESPALSVKKYLGRSLVI